LNKSKVQDPFKNAKAFESCKVDTPLVDIFIAIEPQHILSRYVNAIDVIMPFESDQPNRLK